MLKDNRASVNSPLPDYPVSIVAEGLFDEVPARVAIGSVEFDPQQGFKLTRTGDLFFQTQEGILTLETISGHCIRLFDFDARKGTRSVVIPYSTLMFDAALLSNLDLNADVKYEHWKLPCNRILENIPERPASVKMEHRTVTNIRAKNRELLKGKVGTWQAELCLEIAYMFRGEGTGSQHIDPLVSFHTVYRRPQVFQVVHRHERQLRDFLDFVWMRDHDEPHLLLWSSDGFTRFSKKHRPDVRPPMPAKTIVYSNQLVLDQFNGWLNKWLAFPVELQRALQNVLRVIRYPMVITDLRMVMALHAFEAMHELRPGKKQMSLLDRLKDGASPYITYRQYDQDEPIVEYFSRLVEARNQIIHLRHKPKAALVGKERTRATYEMLIVVRAMVLDLFGCDNETISEYARVAFANIGQISFKYDSA